MSKTGWCMTQDCDTEKKRGGCPVQSGSNTACSCECHAGATEARGFLAIVPRFSAADREPEDQEQPAA